MTVKTTFFTEFCPLFSSQRIVKFVTMKINEILVLGTNLNSTPQFNKIAKKVNATNGVLKINIDLEDWESIVRIEYNQAVINSTKIIVLFKQQGVKCYELLD